MIGFLVLVALVALVSLVVAQVNSRMTQRHRLATEFAQLRKVVDADVTRFGEELQELHIETLGTRLDAPMRQDYQRALDSYEDAKTLLDDATGPDDLSPVTRTLEDGRYAQACVVARMNGKELPQRRPPCFFNPAHGPAQTDIDWAPPGGEEREIPVCQADAERIAAGAEPDARQVRSGNRMVPWYQGGPAYAPYAHGYYGSYAMNGLFPAFLIGSMMSGIWAPEVTAAPADAGGDWSGSDAAGGDAGGGDFGSGADGGDLGGGDLGDFGF